MTDAKTLIAEMAAGAKAAQIQLGQSQHSARQAALTISARLIRDAEADILNANATDVEAGKARGLTDAFIDRLTLTAERIDAMAGGLEAIASLPDPLGAELARWQVPSG